MNTKLLRQKILDLAIRGKLTEQKKSDGTTKDLLAQIQDERRETNDESDAGKKGSSNVILERTSNVIASEAKQSKKSKPAEPKTIIPLNKDEAPFEIPENWEWVRLGDLISLKSGDCIRVTGLSSENAYPVYGGNGINGSYNAYNVEKDTLIIGRVGFYCGSVHKTQSQSWVTDNALVASFKFHNVCNVDFFEKLLSHLDLGSTSNSTAQPVVSGKSLYPVEIPLPPLAEQQRIVTAIESAFAEITAIENNQELLKKHIKQGRQKILDLAIRGKLTQQLKTDGTTKDLLTQIQDERRETNDESDAGKKGSSNVILERTSNVILERTFNVIASEAKQSKKSKPAEPKTIIPLNKDEAPFEIPETWEWVRLGDVAKVINGKNQSAVVNPKGKYPIYGSGGVMGFADDFLCPAHCTIIGRKGSINNPILVETEFWNVDTAFGMSPNELIDYKYFHYFCKSFDFTTLDSSTAMPSLTKTNVEKVQIPLPPLAEQQRIVAAIESAFAEFDAMEKL